MAFVGVVLAGGQSSRMGCDKALLHHTSETLLARCQRLLLEAGADKVLISRNDGAPGHLADHFADRGPLGGIHAAICAEPGPDLLVVPVDLPLLTPLTLSTLVQQGQQNMRSCHYRRHHLPLFVVQPSTLLPQLSATLEANAELSIRHFFGRFPLLELEADDPAALTNANTPAEWQAIQNFSLQSESLHDSRIR